MCYFITAVLSPDSNIEKVALMAKSFQLNWVSIYNKSVSQYLEKGSHYFYTANGLCDCDTSLGKLNRCRSRRKADFDIQIQRFLRKGWSQSKVNNWLEEKEKIQEREKRIALNSDKGLDAERWFEFVNQVLDQKLTSFFSLLLHSYHGSLEGELVSIEGLINVDVADFSVGFLLNMKEDTFYQFH
ncbi:hypothetical protein EYS14_13755 [Alteromonadaceae bacterium M269]|nr:hypothetical protein EYS14_13755 [Alteromonadaceae bacterium M269]